MSKPFNRNAVKPGDVLVLASDESVEAVYRGMGHGMVIADRLVAVPGRPTSILGRQRDFRIKDTTQ